MLLFTSPTLVLKSRSKRTSRRRFIPTSDMHSLPFSDAGEANRHHVKLTNANNQGIQLRHDCIPRFLNADAVVAASIVAALIEKLFQKWRDNFFLQSVPVYFPWTCAGENGNASHAAAQRQVHGQAIARNQTAVTLHIGQMLKQGGPALKYVHLPALPTPVRSSTHHNRPIVSSARLDRRSMR